MGTITTNDGTEIFYKDWGSGQAIVFSHGWPLSADDWDAQGCRPRKPKRSTQICWPSSNPDGTEHFLAQEVPECPTVPIGDTSVCSP